MGLVGLDYVLGALFGVLRGVVVGMLLMILLMNLGFTQDDWWQESRMVDRLLGVMDRIPDHLPNEALTMYNKITMR